MDEVGILLGGDGKSMRRMSPGEVEGFRQGLATIPDGHSLFYDHDLSFERGVQLVMGWKQPVWSSAEKEREETKDGD
ncbi:MAG: hypothetical protein UY48_C0002G0026 [Candidatus Gottesmanbacteria bacterium GW2011_GWB1_49_7]|uniref:Uncharacterized protein n=1 Tax=Candidatus Gottesmanbacteria bacterium GW2011_GWB1_49_7 TaxID=1618448 RepID=A0A0G1W428_9BACT|nr:MAG: hypothetical protein UY48_C0002G0026 [Candidatus Gottesmanbacteria bacterium GW2011_GWB1_49_7]